MLRSMQNQGNPAQPETHIHFLFAEPRTADSVRKRIEIIVQNLCRNKVFAELMELALFGVTIAVSSEGIKSAIETGSFSVPIKVEVVEELQDLISS